MAESERDPLIPPDDVESGLKSCEGSRWARARARAGEILESRRTHQLVITLIAIDGTCVLIDLGYTFLSPGCEAIAGDRWLDILSYISLAITTLFTVEIPITLWALGSAYYNPVGGAPQAWLHLFDALVIITTFVLEIVLGGRERELAGMLVLLRLWRLVKLVGGVAVGAGELQEETYEDLEQTRRKLEETVKELEAVRAENNALRERIGQQDAPED
ncbi:hypothetical protein PLICRDRAFT_161901 [Plicaturopsis crispa FD-325 SS-3]|nr:hypothetical protein PLICRDRAFT_161901 [Plicaturopsis crispa FD-325 SS-3]